jgi:hypothetical protein
LFRPAAAIRISFFRGLSLIRSRFRFSPDLCPPVVPPSVLRFDPLRSNGCQLQGFAPRMNARPDVTGEITPAERPS